MTLNIREMRIKLRCTQSEFAERYNIPFRTIQNWENGVRQPADYILSMLEEKVCRDLINHKTFSIPKYDEKKKDLPSIEDFPNNFEWMKAIQSILGENLVFALDESLMCQELFLGYYRQYAVWVYTDNPLAYEYNGVIVLGDSIDKQYVEERNGIKYTNLNRTVIDSIVNEDLLDWQGIAEGLSKYYETHNQSFEGLFIPPEYQEKFEELSDMAINYYTY